MNIGFYLLDIDQENQNCLGLLAMINDLCLLRPKDNIVVFSNTPNAIIQGNRYYMLHVSQAKFFKGNLYLFDHKSRLLTQTFKTPAKQVMYIAEIPWGRESTTQNLYTQWQNQYGSSNLEFIAHSQEVYDLLDICWKKPVKLLPQLSAEEFNNVIEEIQ
jgi:hypothetical protein